MRAEGGKVIALGLQCDSNNPTERERLEMFLGVFDLPNVINHLIKLQKLEPIFHTHIFFFQQSSSREVLTRNTLFKKKLATKNPVSSNAVSPFFKNEAWKTLVMSLPNQWAHEELLLGDTLIFIPSMRKD